MKERRLQDLFTHLCFIRVNLWPMRLKELEAPDFDLARTLDSGQVFHWEKCGDGYAGTIGANAASHAIKLTIGGHF